jgi:hypothetical protein
MEESPVNILSVRCLAEQFTDSNGHVDRRGTGIESIFEQHTLFWNKRQFSKTFYTAQSGYPECLFNSGYTRFNAYTTYVANYIDDTIHWAFLSDKRYVPSQKLRSDDKVGFLQGMKLLYNSGDGVKDVATFQGIDFVDGMQRSCKIGRSDGSTSVVLPETLLFIENPDIASIPQTTEQYAREACNLTPQQFSSIANPQTLSPLQEEMLSLHTRLHHLPIPKMIALAEKGEIPKRLALLKGRAPVCVACLFA